MAKNLTPYPMVSVNETMFVKRLGDKLLFLLKKKKKRIKEDFFLFALTLLNSLS